MLSDGLRCHAHAHESAVAACASCGAMLCGVCRNVRVDGLSACVECRDAEETAPSAPVVAAVAFPPAAAPATVIPAVAASVPIPDPIPWEQPERYGSATALWLTLAAFLRSPLLGVLRIPWEKQDFRTPLILHVTCGILGQLGVLFAAFVLTDVHADLASHFAPYGVSPAAGTLLSVTTLPLLLTLRLFALSAISHALLRAAGAVRRPYEATFRVFAYAGVASLLSLIPGLGVPLTLGMTLLLTMLGLRVAHATTPGQALLGTTPSFFGLLLDLGL